MKNKNIRTLLIPVVLALAGAGIYLVAGRGDAGSKAAPVAAPVPAEKAPPDLLKPAPELSPSTSVTDTGGMALRNIDIEILGRVQKGIDGAKLEDALAGKSYRLDLYRDQGRKLVSRLKIDIDRDGKWDEKWSLDEYGRIKRQVSSADDDTTYDLEYDIQGKRWMSAAELAAQRPESAPVPPGETAASASGSVQLRAMDHEILKIAGTPATSARKKDAFPDKPYSVSFHRDPGKLAWSRVMIDLDRDAKDDEKWTFEGNKVNRQISPEDNGQYSLEYRLVGGVWAPKKEKASQKGKPK